MDRSGIPSDGPDAVLTRIVRRLRLRYSRAHIARCLAAHPRPNSLLALVEVASDLGLKVTPARTEASALGELARPMIVHFGAGAAGGFGVLEAVTPEGFKVWDSSNGLHVVEREAFLEHWSGIVGLVERAAERGPKEPSFLRNRMAEFVFRGWESPEMVGRAAAGMCAMLAVLVIALLALAVVAAPSDDRAAAASVAVVSMVGLMVTIVTAVSVGSQDSPLADRICARGKLVDCHSVLSSPYSRIFGIALSDIGIAFFGSLLLLMMTSVVAQGSSVWSVVAIAYAAALPFSLILVSAQVAMRQLCTLCLAVHLVNASGAAITWLWLRPDEWPVGDIAPSLLLSALFFYIVLFLTVPYFKKHQGLVVLAGMQRRISGSPFASLAEVLTAEPTGVRGPTCGVALEGPGGHHELLVLAHPSCNKCDEVLGEARALAQAGMVRAHVGLAPKDPEEADRRACAAVIAVALAAGPERLFEAYAAAKKRLRSLLTEDPVTVLAGELSLSGVEVQGAVDDARRVIDRAEEFVDAHAQGTPAVFLDSRLYQGPLAHLAYLLQNHPELLADVRLESRDAGHEREEVSPS